MQIMDAILLGIVQGLTEFLPISSSGHLILTEKLFGLGVGSLLFDVMLHGGTLLALIVYFWGDLVTLLKGVFKRQTDSVGWLIILATIPAAIAGFLLQDLAESSFRSVGLVAFNLIWVALLMIWVERRPQDKGMSQLKSRNALLVGLAQALALIPGVSRSGITIVAGMSQRLSRAEAARFSFLLAIPITIGAILKLLMGGGFGQLTSQLPVFVAGLSAATFTGYIAISFLIKYLSDHRLLVFAAYRLALAAFLLAGLGTGWL